MAVEPLPRGGGGGHMNCIGMQAYIYWAIGLVMLVVGASVPVRPFFCWGGGGNIPLEHLEAGVSEEGGGGGHMAPNVRGGGQSIICPPPQQN